MNVRWINPLKTNETDPNTMSALGTEFTVQQPQATASGKAYACSTIGFIHTGALISSLVAFICNESATWCNWRECIFPLYGSTYQYFSAMTLLGFLVAFMLYVLHCTALYEMIPCDKRQKVLAELGSIAVVILLLIFGNLFMISRTGNLTIYMVSTFFGCLAMSFFGIQLVMIILPNLSLLSAGNDADSEDGDSDGSESPSPGGKFGIQMTGAKCTDIGGYALGKQETNCSSLNSSNQSTLSAAGNDITGTFSIAEQDD